MEVKQRGMKFVVYDGDRVVSIHDCRKEAELVVTQKRRESLICPKCGYRARNEAGLKTHIRLKHGGDKDDQERRQ